MNVFKFLISTVTFTFHTKLCSISTLNELFHISNINTISTLTFTFTPNFVHNKVCSISTLYKHLPVIPTKYQGIHSSLMK